MPEESIDTVDLDAAPSVDDFIRQLEEKEKDLHITSELEIEVEESEFDERNIPDDIVPAELKSPAPAVSAKPSAAPSSDTRQQPGNKTRIYELEQEVDSLKKRLAVLREERNDVQEKSDRRLKDFESFKYRMDRERRGAFIDQISNLASQMLPVFDNLDRALTAAKELEKSPGFEQFYDGIVMVNQQMSEIFQDMDDFKAKMDRMNQETAKLAQVAQNGDFDALKAQVGETGKACKACHDKYRNK